MLWGKQEEKLPRELEGLTPEQVVQKLKDAELATQQANEFKTKFEARDAEFNTMKTEHETVKNRLGELTLAEQRRQEALRRAAGEEEPTTIFADPDKYVDERTKQTREMAIVSGIMSAKLYARQSLTARDQKIFAKYEKEVDGIVGTYPPEQRIMPQTWLNAIIYVKGLHQDDIIKAESEHTDFFAEVPAPGHREEEKRDEVLSQEEQEVCRVMKWDPASYLKRKKEQKVVGTHILY